MCFTEGIVEQKELKLHHLISFWSFCWLQISFDLFLNGTRLGYFCLLNTHNFLLNSTLLSGWKKKPP